MRIINNKLNILITLVVLSIALLSILMVVWFDVDPGQGSGSGITSIKKAEKYHNKNTTVVELDSSAILWDDPAVIELLNNSEFQKFMKSSEFNKFRKSFNDNKNNKLSQKVSTIDLQKFMKGNKYEKFMKNQAFQKFMKTENFAKFMKSNQFQKFMKGENFNKFQKQFN